jgi:hypothetical protein
MATTSGKAANLKVIKNDSFDIGILWLEEDSGVPALFVLWEYTAFTPAPSAFDRIAESMWVSLLKDAIAHDLPVVIGHADNSSVVEEVTLVRDTGP